MNDSLSARSTNIVICDIFLAEDKQIKSPSKFNQRMIGKTIECDNVILAAPNDLPKVAVGPVWPMDDGRYRGTGPHTESSRANNNCNTFAYN